MIANGDAYMKLQITPNFETLDDWHVAGLADFHQQCAP
jgi:hypothetical protein